MRILSVVVLSTALLGGPVSVHAQQPATEQQAKPPAHPQPQGRPVHGTNTTPVVEAPRNGHPVKPPAAKPSSAKPSSAKPGAVKPGASKAAAKPVVKAGPAESPTPPAEAAPRTPPVDNTKGSVTGLPLPRWASLRPDEVNLRAGPGTRYPIDWVYKRRDLPVRILREFGLWRLVEDQDLVKGWVHQATLIGRRNLVVTGSERMLRGDGRDDASPVARLKPGVIGRIRSCEASSNWCEVQVSDYRGWLKRDEFWGTVPGEAIP